MQACKLSIGLLEKGGPSIQDHPRLQSKSEGSLGYTRPYLRTNK